MQSPSSRNNKCISQLREAISAFKHEAQHLNFIDYLNLLTHHQDLKDLK